MICPPLPTCGNPVLNPPVLQQAFTPVPRKTMPCSTASALACMLPFPCPPFLEAGHSLSCDLILSRYCCRRLPTPLSTPSALLRLHSLSSSCPQPCLSARLLLSRLIHSCACRSPLPPPALSLAFKPRLLCSCCLSCLPCLSLPLPHISCCHSVAAVQTGRTGCLHVAVSNM